MIDYIKGILYSPDITNNIIQEVVKHYSIDIAKINIVNWEYDVFLNAIRYCIEFNENGEDKMIEFRHNTDAKLVAPDDVIDIPCRSVTEECIIEFIESLERQIEELKKEDGDAETIQALKNIRGIWLNRLKGGSKHGY